jgi:protoporphyrinogen oxidase
MANTKTEKRIIIIGAGPTGLGAAYRLNKLGYKNWAIYEKEDRIGGLSSSFIDEKGFTWDIGGHVMFSNISDFNDLVETLMGNNYLSHDRESWIRMMDRWIPYPFQNNLHHLSRESVLQCLLGLIQAQMHPKKIANFEDWILQIFGKGIAQHFMLPYNLKVWAFPPSTMAFKWIAERISLISIEKVLKNVIMNIDDTGWGPNNRFKFPLHGGTGGFFNYFEPFIKKHLYYRHQLNHVDMENRIIAFTNGKEERYDTLINTTPLDLFTRGLHSRKQDTKKLHKYAGTLAHNGVYVVGIGLKKPVNGTKCWVYFPEEHIPFYRMTYFSHYSPNNVPQGDTATYSSLMCEISFSSYKAFPEDRVISDTIQGLVTSGILSQNDKKKIVSTWLHKVDYAYPVPTLERDKALIAIQPVLENNRIYSRGRFGAWKYEVGNMDHSVMMGMEVVNRILFKTREKIWNL